MTFKQTTINSNDKIIYKYKREFVHFDLLISTLFMKCESWHKILEVKIGVGNLSQKIKFSLQLTLNCDTKFSIC